MGVKKVGTRQRAVVGKLGKRVFAKGASLQTKAQRDATAKKIISKTNAWAKKTMKGVW